MNLCYLLIMTTLALKSNKKLKNIFRQNNIRFAALFGSRAKKTNKQNSDFDFVIEFSPKKDYSLLDIIGVKNSLEDVLKKPVDVITKSSINPLMKKEVLKTMKIFYEG